MLFRQFNMTKTIIQRYADSFYGALQILSMVQHENMATHTDISKSN